MGKKTTANDKEGQGELYSPEYAIKVEESGGRTTAKDEEGQGELYSPLYAMKVDNSEEDQNKQQDEEGEEEETSKGTKKLAAVTEAAESVRKNIVGVKERLMEKLTAASVPADAMENARHFLETVVRDATVAAQGLTKEVIGRIKSHLAVLLPSLPPAVTGKMVDEAAAVNTVQEMKQQPEEDEKQRKTTTGRIQPASRL